LITGADGQLGHELRRVLTSHELISCIWPDFDLLKPDVEQRILDARPEVVIHAAAYTNVDQAESQPDLAMAVNAEGTEKVARAATKTGARLFYVSTDYVFDGMKRLPYVESDMPNPMNVYGTSKLEGERRALACCPETLVIRTAWLYGAQGHNFVKTIMRLATEQPALRVVADQRGCPTHASDLAHAISRLLTTDLKGVVHATGMGDCTWHEFAQAIVGLMRTSVKVEAITTEEAGRPARRPAYSVMAHLRLSHVGIAMPDWKEALTRFVRDMYPVTPIRA
ncbi:MAG: dTDP-4-dehydrorhamnose reductase, partial [Nitrospiraceae bacterium]